MPKKVRIMCRYYRVVEQVNEKVTDNIYDLRRWIVDMDQKSLEARYKENGSVKGRLENVKSMGSDNVFAFNFMRTSETNTAYRLKTTEEAHHIDSKRLIVST